MFSKAKKKNDDALMEVGDLAAPEPARKAQGKAPARQTKPARAPAGVPSLISADVVIRGAIESEGEVQFDGEIEGDIAAKGLVIGEGARVSGEVRAEKVRVCGVVEGAIRATRVELAAGALVKGDIIHTALAIEAGARFEGNVRHSDDPIGQAGLLEQREAPMPVADMTARAEKALKAPSELVEPTMSGELAMADAATLTRTPGARRAKADLR